MRINDREFELYLTSDEIAIAVSEIAEKLNTILQSKNPHFIIILNGAFIFGADLLRKFSGKCDISFSRIKSYDGMNSGEISEFSGFQTMVTNRNIVIIEDIIDTGKTVFHLMNELEPRKPESILVVSLLQKNILRPNLIKADLTGFEIPDHFVVGYGLDYDGEGRNLKDIWRLG